MLMHMAAGLVQENTSFCIDAKNCLTTVRQSLDTKEQLLCFSILFHCVYEEGRLRFT